MAVKVSIIVPVYNACNYLQNTVELLSTQTLKEIEIILVDDGSTDGSSELCDKLAQSDSRIICLHIENNGVSNARNKGIAVAKGEYIGFSDADDSSDKTLYETLYNLAENNKTQISMVKYATVFEDGKVINDEGTKEITIYNDKNKVLSDFFAGKLYSGVYTKLFKSELCKNISFDVTKCINEDKMFIFNALRYADSCCYQDISLYTYIRRAGSLSNDKFSEIQFGLINSADEMEKIVADEYPQIIDFAKANTVYSYMKLLKIMCLTHCEKEYKDKYNDLVKAMREYKISFCKNYLTKNDFIKWFALKINKKFFKALVIKFART